MDTVNLDLHLLIVHDEGCGDKDAGHAKELAVSVDNVPVWEQFLAESGHDYSKWNLLQINLMNIRNDHGVTYEGAPSNDH